VILPSAVHAELTNRKAPLAVRDWIANPPAWLEICDDRSLSFDPSLEALDEGEKSAISLAASLNADFLLMDDREGVAAARRKGLRVTGTLGVLDVAAAMGLVDFAQAVKKLELTSFRRPRAVLLALLKRHDKSGNA
jgi:predicted nucleic acid-binding protein